MSSDTQQGAPVLRKMSSEVPQPGTPRGVQNSSSSPYATTRYLYGPQDRVQERRNSPPLLEPNNSAARRVEPLQVLNNTAPSPKVGTSGDRGATLESLLREVEHTSLYGKTPVSFESFDRGSTTPLNDPPHVRSQNDPPHLLSRSLHAQFPEGGDFPEHVGPWPKSPRNGGNVALRGKYPMVPPLLQHSGGWGQDTLPTCTPMITNKNVVKITQRNLTRGVSEVYNLNPAHTHTKQKFAAPSEDMYTRTLATGSLSLTEPPSAKPANPAPPPLLESHPPKTLPVYSRPIGGSDAPPHTAMRKPAEDPIMARFHERTLHGASYAPDWSVLKAGGDGPSGNGETHKSDQEGVTSPLRRNSFSNKPVALKVKPVMQDWHQAQDAPPSEGAQGQQKSRLYEATDGIINFHGHYMEDPTPSTRAMYQEATAKLRESLKSFLKEQEPPTEDKEGWSWGLGGRWGNEDEGLVLGDEEAKLLKDYCRSELGRDVQLLGLHVKTATGMRVKAVTKGLAHAGDNAGVVTMISNNGLSCWVKWDHMDVECGWYKVGMKGIFSLKLLPESLETPQLPHDMMRTGTNSLADIDARARLYKSETRLAADNVLCDIGNLLGM